MDKSLRNAIPIGGQPANRNSVMLKPVVMHGVSNENIMVNVKESEVGECDIKLNRLTVLAYSLITVYGEEQKEIYKLWTSGGFIFFADTDAFLGVKHEEKDKGVETGESGASNSSN